MPKKKVDKPLFLEFVNFPIFDKKILYDQRSDFIEDYSGIDIGMDNSSVQKFGPSVRGCMEHLFRNFDNKFSKEQATWLKEKLFDTDFDVVNPIAHNKYDEDISYRDALVLDLLLSWCFLKNLFNDLIAADIERGGKDEPCSKWVETLESLNYILGYVSAGIAEGILIPR